MKKCIVYAVSLAAVIGYAQAPDTLWTKTYGGSADDIGYAIQQTFDGGYIIVGETRSFGAGDADVWLLKIDENGDTVWTQTYGGDSTDIGYSVQQTVEDSGYIIAGETRSFGAGGSDVYLIKTDSLGNTLWTQTYGDSFDDCGYSVQDLEDRFLITGYRGFTGWNWDVYLITTYLDGQVQWERTWGYPYSRERGYSVQECTDGYIIAGYSYTRGGGYALLLQTDWSGNPLWNERYNVDYGGKPPAGVFRSVQPTADGGYIAAGWPYVYLVKTDSMGDTLWVKQHGTWDEYLARSVHLTSDGCYIITGTADSDILLLKTDENGDIIWTIICGISSEDDEGYSVQQTSDGGYVIVGYTKSFGAGESDVWLIKTEPDLGVEENESSVVANKGITATIFRGPLQLPADKKCKVYDITGRVVAPDKIQPGIYFIEIDGVVTQKVVKVR